MTLVLIGLVGGIITGLSPCVLPVLPVVLLGGGSAGPDTVAARRRPYAVVLGLTVSFAVFTLFGSLLLTVLHLPDSAIRWTGLGLLVLVGLGLLVPPLGHLIERPFYRFPQLTPRAGRSGFLLGVALGAVFVPCAGPVLAAITVAGATGRVGLGTISLTLGFAVGTAIPLLAFALAGRGMSRRLQAYRRRQALFRRVSGAVMIVLAVALTFNLSDVVQRDIPNYTQSLGDSLEKGVSAASGGGRSSADCRSVLSSGTGLMNCGAAPAFTGIGTWLNTPGGKPVTLASLRGKVVLVDFWAYSCINCQRELPHVEAWAKTYASAGFEVVGVHTPEYAFEHVPSNVAAGTRRLGLTFPVALDNSYATWNAYGNQSWPAAYLIDATGQIRHVAVGEGDYGGEERLIRQLLTTAHPGRALPAATEVPDTTPGDPDQTPELYLGAERQQGYHGAAAYETGRFSLPAALPADSFALSGTWSVGQESITSGGDARLRLSFHASEVYLDVGGTGTLTVSSGTTRKTVLVSGAPDIRTVVSTESPRAGTVTIGLSPGLTAYSFTFG
ncbi:cytochrome c biogenesis protein DipZ [Streptomyces sp. NPDC090080]|uniref:cytochrome c biogenesis protein DipZ n=1 Tax=Streptomyces sp. NPDC090080 TaxID=3365939 RepID=UPI003830B423